MPTNPKGFFICSALLASVTLFSACSSQIPASPVAKPASVEATMDIPTAALNRLHTALVDAERSPLPYPWTGIEENDTSLILVGYGSLLNPRSAARTVRDTPAQGHPPVLAVGAVRLFNYRIPEGRLTNFGPIENPAQAGALNLVPNPNAAFNGRLLEVKAADIPALREREYGYDLIPVTYVNWGDWNAEPRIAYALSARQAQVAGRQVLDDTVLPNPGYLQLCVEGARMVSVEFADYFLRTTLLADGITPLAQTRHADSAEERRDP